MRILINYILFIFCFASFSQTNDFVGFATGEVSYNNEIIEVFGFANKEAKQKYSENTIQNIGSVSKTLIGISMMIVKEQGLIDLDTDINEYLDFEVRNPNHPNKIITLRHLATHTSGIVDVWKTYKISYVKSTIPEMELDQYLQACLSSSGAYYSKKIFHSNAPGSKYEYSNIGSALAALVIEGAVGMRFDEFSSKYILQPLNMNTSGWSYNAINEAHHAVLYDEKGKPLSFKYTLITYPDGGLRTSPIDLAKYVRELIKGYHHESTLLSNTSWDELFQKQLFHGEITGIDLTKKNSGLFFEHSKGGWIGHSGSDPGASSMIRFLPERKKGYLFMANQDITKKNIETFKSIWITLTK